MKINFRSPNVDRFVEICLTSTFFEREIKAYIENAPKGYNTFIYELDGLVSSEVFSPAIATFHSLENSCFICEYPPKTSISDCFYDKYEPLEDIKDRILSVKPCSNDKLSSAAFAILKNWAEKLEANRDNVKEVLDMAFVIASMASHSQIEAEDLAEACQYHRKTFDAIKNS